jgi:hypothetical protein
MPYYRQNESYYYPQPLYYDNDQFYQSYMPQLVLRSNSDATLLPDSPVDNSDNHEKNTNIYIRGLDPDTSDTDLYNICQSYISSI